MENPLAHKPAEKLMRKAIDEYKQERLRYVSLEHWLYDRLKRAGFLTKAAKGIKS